MMPRVYIIILNYKNWMDTRECLETVFRSDYDSYTVVVIDNDSQNNSLEQLMAWAGNETARPQLLTTFSKAQVQKPILYSFHHSRELNDEFTIADLKRLVFIQNETNKGFAGGINPILRQLIHQDAYVWLLNPDMIVEESTLSNLVRFADKVDRNVIIGSVIKYYAAPSEIQLYAGGRINFNSATIEFIKDKRSIDHLDYITGGSLFTHATNFIELGLLPEEYFLYWEETDFCYRAKKKGYRLLLCESAVCYDKVSTSIGKNFLSDYYYTRNGLMFLSKYKKEKVPAAVFLTFFRLIKRILSGQPNRAKGVYKGMLSFLNKKRHAH